MRIMGLLWLLLHLGQMTKTDKFFLLDRLLKRATYGFLKSFSFAPMSRVFAPMSRIFAIPMLSTIYEEPEEVSVGTTDDEMISAPSHNSSSVNGRILSRDIDDDEITSRFVKNVSTASSCGSNSPLGSIFKVADDDDEVSSAYRRA
ncbi:hypothetical protein ATCVCanal1_724L [Acanthocystis turfacea Chlorella virus Canal-1]|nr:hypothetical protein ATCVCanal1_724L [Acanthocystis turfacea Chlorella virus Canal-1]